MKKCPYCAEDIQDIAKKCRYCGEWLDKTTTLQVEGHHDGTGPSDLSDMATAIDNKQKSSLEKKLEHIESAEIEITSSDDVKIISGRMFASMKNEEGEAFCLGCRKVGNVNEMYYCKETDEYYHEQCLTNQEQSSIAGQPARQERKWGWGWFVLCSVYSMQFNPAIHKIKPYTTHPLLIIVGFIVLLVMYFVLRNSMIKKKHFINSAGLIAGIISLIVTFVFIGFFTGIIDRVSTKEQQIMAAKDMSASIKDFVNVMDGKESGTPLKKSPQLYAEFQPVMDLLYTHISTAKNDYIEFNNTLEKESIETILNPATLSNRTKVIAARRKLERINQLYNNYEMLLENRATEFKKRISQLELKDNLKEEFISGFNRGLKEREAIFKEYFKTERASLAEMDNVLSFFLKRTDKYRIENGKIIFYEKNDLKQYDNFMRKLDNLVKEESTWHDKYRELLLSQAKKLEKVTGN